MTYQPETGNRKLRTKSENYRTGGKEFDVKNVTPCAGITRIRFQGFTLSYPEKT